MADLKRFSKTRWDYCTVRFEGIGSVHKLLSDIYLRGFTWYPVNHGYDKFPYAYAVHGEGGSNIIIFAFRPKNVKVENHYTHHFYNTIRFEILLNFSGAGLDAFMTYLAKDGRTFEDSLKAMYKNNGCFTRLDLARTLYNYDDKVHSAKYAAQQAYEGNLCTKARYCKWLTSFNSAGGNSHAYHDVGEGDTLYIGRSPKQLRIYNKLAEECPMCVDSQGISRFAHSKYSAETRYEIQVNHQYAQDLVANWISNKCDDLKTWQSFMKTNYRFISRQGQSYHRNRNDYSTATWYKNLVDKGGLYVQTSEHLPHTTFKMSYRWIGRQCMPRLSTIMQARVEMYRQLCGNSKIAKRLALRDFWRWVQDTDNRRHAVDRSMMNDWLVQSGFDAYYPNGTIVYQPRKSWVLKHKEIVPVA